MHAIYLGKLHVNLMFIVVARVVGWCLSTIWWNRMSHVLVQPKKHTQLARLIIVRGYLFGTHKKTNYDKDPHCMNAMIQLQR